MLSGLALIPDEETCRAVIEASHAARPILSEDSPCLSMEGNRVHCTVFQFPAVDATPWTALLEVLRVEAGGPLRASVAGVSLQPPNWLFADLSAEPWTARIARAMAAACQPYVAMDRLRPAADVAGYPPAEAASYLLRGYRYAGALWRPHLTIGTVAAAGAGPALPDCVAGTLDGHQVMFRAATAYVAGPHGAHASTRHEIPLTRPA